MEFSPHPLGYRTHQGNQANQLLEMNVGYCSFPVRGRQKKINVGHVERRLSCGCDSDTDRSVRVTALR